MLSGFPYSLSLIFSDILGIAWVELICIYAYDLLSSPERDTAVSPAVDSKYKQ